MRKSLIFFALYLLVIISASAQEKSQMQQVMEIHDEVMADLGVVVKLVNQLQSKVDSTEAGKKRLAAIENLKAANKSMADWMQGFGERFDADEMMKGKTLTSQKKAWLDEEEIKVKAMRDQVNSSIENAKSLL